MGKVYRSKWDRIIAAARDIALSYSTPVTLRQLFYRLVAAQYFPNNDSSYTTLSSLTAQGRRDGTFPDLMDTTRSIEEPAFFDSPAAAVRSVRRWYREDRLADQPVSLYLGVEKRGLIAQLNAWFGEPYHIPVLPLGGMASQSFIDVVRADVAHREQVYGRKAVLLYAGDFDASGIAIDRVFTERTAGCFAEVRRIALNPEQVTEFGFARQKGKPGDNNTEAFVEKYGDAALFDPADPYVMYKGQRRFQTVQVELDALAPDDLREQFTDVIEEFVDLSEISAAAEAERDSRKHLTTLAEVAWRFTTEELRELIASKEADDD